MTAPTFAADVETMAEQLRQLTDQRNELQTALDRAVASLAAANGTVEAVQRQHRDDVELIGSSLIESTTDTGDAGIYDTLVDNVNYRLNVPLPLRRRRYEVRINVEVTLGVEADSEEDARDEANSDIRRIESTIDNYSTDTSYSVRSSVDSQYDWTVEEEDE